MSFTNSFINLANAADDNVAAFGNVLNPIIDNIIVPIVQLLFAIALVVFVYGVAQMIFHKTDAESHKQGRLSIIGGLVGMFIMVTAWGIIYLIANTIGEFR